MQGLILSPAEVRERKDFRANQAPVIQKKSAEGAGWREEQGRQLRAPFSSLPLTQLCSCPVPSPSRWLAFGICGASGVPARTWLSMPRSFFSPDSPLRGGKRARPFQRH